MKYIIINIMLLLSLSADDLQRIESILNDIVELRSDLQECQASLEDKELSEEIDKPSSMITQLNRCIENEEKLHHYKKLYNDEKAQNNVLKTQLSIFSSANPDKKDKEIKRYKKLLKIKEYELEQLKNRIKSRKITKNNSLKKELCKVMTFESVENIFPKLKMKKKYEEGIQIVKNKKILSKKEKIINFKAATFRLEYDSVVYDGVDGKKLFVWKKGKSFTSNIKTLSWIKVTGYFEKRRWTPSKKDMWIKISQVKKR